MPLRLFFLDDLSSKIAAKSTPTAPFSKPVHSTAAAAAAATASLVRDVAKEGTTARESRVTTKARYATGPSDADADVGADADADADARGDERDGDDGGRGRPESSSRGGGGPTPDATPRSTAMAPRFFVLEEGRKASFTLSRTPAALRTRFEFEPKAREELGDGEGSSSCCVDDGSTSGDRDDGSAGARIAVADCAIECRDFDGDGDVDGKCEDDAGGLGHDPSSPDEIFLFGGFELLSTADSVLVYVTKSKLAQPRLPAMPKISKGAAAKEEREEYLTTCRGVRARDVSPLSDAASAAAATVSKTNCGEGGDDEKKTESGDVNDNAISGNVRTTALRTVTEAEPCKGGGDGKDRSSKRETDGRCLPVMDNQKSDGDFNRGGDDAREWNRFVLVNPGGPKPVTRVRLKLSFGGEGRGRRQRPLPCDVNKDIAVRSLKLKCRFRDAARFPPAADPGGFGGVAFANPAGGAGSPFPMTSGGTFGGAPAGGGIAAMMAMVASAGGGEMPSSLPPQLLQQRQPPPPFQQRHDHPGEERSIMDERRQAELVSSIAGLGIHMKMIEERTARAFHLGLSEMESRINERLEGLSSRLEALERRGVAASDVGVTNGARECSHAADGAGELSDDFPDGAGVGG